MRGKNGRSSSSSDFNVKLDWPRSRSSRRLVYIVLYEILEEACCMACTRCFDPRDSVETDSKNPGQPGRSSLIVRSLLNCDYYFKSECKDARRLELRWMDLSLCVLLAEDVPTVFFLLLLLLGTTT